MRRLYHSFRAVSTPTQKENSFTQRRKGDAKTQRYSSRLCVFPLRLCVKYLERTVDRVSDCVSIHRTARQAASVSLLVYVKLVSVRIEAPAVEFSVVIGRARSRKSPRRVLGRAQIVRRCQVSHTGTKGSRGFTQINADLRLSAFHLRLLHFLRAVELEEH